MDESLNRVPVYRCYNDSASNRGMDSSSS